MAPPRARLGTGGAIEMAGGKNRNGHFANLAPNPIMSTARKVALNDRAKEKREANKTNLTAAPAGGSMGIASFFKPKPAAAAAKDVEMTDETSRDSASAPADTPTKEVEKVSPTPDTQKVGRKRIKRVESSDEEDNAPEEPPSKKDPARAASPAAEPSASESSAAPEKSPAKSPVKSQGASSKSVASFFTKKPEAESPAANKASEEKTDKTAAAKEAKKEVAAEPHAHSSPAKAQTPAKPAASFFGAAAPKTSRSSPCKETTKD